MGRIAGAIALVAVGWLAVVIALHLWLGARQVDGDRRPDVPGAGIVAKANGRILASNNYVTIARSDDADFVARLYAAGALLVLDAEQAGGCSGLPPRRFTAQL